MTMTSLFNRNIDSLSVHMLLSNGADVTLTNNYGYTANDIADDFVFLPLEEVGVQTNIFMNVKKENEWVESEAIFIMVNIDQTKPWEQGSDSCYHYLFYFNK